MEYPKESTEYIYRLHADIADLNSGPQDCKKQDYSSRHFKHLHSKISCTLRPLTSMGVPSTAKVEVNGESCAYVASSPFPTADAGSGWPVVNMKWEFSFK